MFVKEWLKPERPWPLFNELLHEASNIIKIMNQVVYLDLLSGCLVVVASRSHVLEAVLSILWI